ncbi:SH3 domain-containing protein [Streptomyces sp. NPDC047028]|uniref:SH3 domain-containing protein n=1 Tax=Streptomyces sp. NPDC047028 TaxID=3155793 RepID=UPI0033CC470B
MRAPRRIAPALCCALLCGLALTACGDDGLKGTIEDFDTVTVWSGPGQGARPTGELTTQAPLTIACYDDGWFKVSYDGGSGYIDADTSILSKKGEVAPSMVPTC